MVQKDIWKRIPPLRLKITTHELQHIRKLLKEPALHAIVKKFAIVFVDSIICSSSYAVREVGEQSSLVVREDTEKVPLQVTDTNGVLFDGNPSHFVPLETNSSERALAKHSGLGLFKDLNTVSRTTTQSFC